MLILSRRVNESIVIDGGISIMVTSVKCGVVRLGITCPKHLRVYREEVLEKITRDGGRVPDGGCEEGT